jgi:hypothetical protein
MAIEDPDLGHGLSNLDALADQLVVDRVAVGVQVDVPLDVDAPRVQFAELRDARQQRFDVGLLSHEEF